MRSKLFQTLLVAATITTCSAPLQAFNVVNNTKYWISYWNVEKGNELTSELVPSQGSKKGEGPQTGTFAVCIQQGPVTCSASLAACVLKTKDGTITVTQKTGAGTLWLEAKCTE